VLPVQPRALGGVCVQAAAVVKAEAVKEDCARQQQRLEEEHERRLGALAAELAAMRATHDQRLQLVVCSHRC
jgi:hypothetical protein